MAKTDVKNRLKEIFESTIESGIKYDGPIVNVNYFNIFCKAGEQKALYKMNGNNLCMFNYKYEDKDAIMIIFSMPINTEDSGAKNIAERVMGVVEKIESCFITLDFLKSQEIKEDKFIYVIAIKVI